MSFRFSSIVNSQIHQISGLYSQILMATLHIPLRTCFIIQWRIITLSHCTDSSRRVGSSWAWSWRRASPAACTSSWSPWGQWTGRRALPSPRDLPSLAPESQVHHRSDWRTPSICTEASCKFSQSNITRKFSNETHWPDRVSLVVLGPVGPVAPGLLPEDHLLPGLAV